MKYLHCDGTWHSFVPEPDKFVAVKEDGDLVDEYVVTVYNPITAQEEPAEPVFVARETFGKEPTPEQIKWCMYKHRATQATVHREYYLEY